MLKKLIYSILLIPFLTLSQTSGAWLGHFSYNTIQDIATSDEAIYVAAENALFIYNPTTQEIQKVSTVNGLSGETITTIFYNEANNRIVLGHDNGLIVVYDLNTQEITQVVDIVQKQTISPNSKNINHIMEYNGLLYLSCGFGISVYNIDDLEFDDTYFIGMGGAQLNVTQTTIFEGNIYASTDVGMYNAPIDANNLIDFDEWVLINAFNWLGVQAFAGELYAIIYVIYDDMTEDIIRYQYDNGDMGTNDFTIEQTIYPNPVIDFKVTENNLIVSTQDNIYIYDDSLMEVANLSSFTDFDNVSYNAAITHNNNYYLATTTYGMLAVDSQNLDNPTEIHPQGPLLNSAFAIETLPNELWVVFGDYSFFLNPYPLDSRGISHLINNNNWTHIPYNNTFDARSLVSITTNPTNPNQVFISSFFSGLLQIDDDIPTILHNETNSGLESLNIGDPTYIDIRIGGTAFDNQGNLWIPNSRIENGIKMRTASGDWNSYGITEIIPDPLNDELGMKELVINENNYKFIATVDHGVMGFYENNGNPLIKNITEGENLGNLPSTYVSTLAVDNNNQLWIGTQKGLRVLYNSSAFFSTENPRAEPIIILDDGIPSELLFEQSISDITVDGSNNKWIATTDSGAFYLSENGSETIYHFTKDNSPLPTDAINQIKVDGETGRIYFATPKGIVSFQGNATSPRDDLNDVFAFPNPVRPGYSGDVTIRGLVENSNVKITDIEGNLVFETTSEGGSIQWDLTAFGRHQVASGVYMVLVSNEDGTDTTVNKIMVVR